MAVLPREAIQREAAPAPACQGLASAAADLRLRRWSDHSIAAVFGVTDKTIAKAIRWFRP